MVALGWNLQRIRLIHQLVLDCVQGEGGKSSPMGGNLEGVGARISIGKPAGVMPWHHFEVVGRLMKTSMALY